MANYIRENIEKELFFYSYLLLQNVRKKWPFIEKLLWSRKVSPWCYDTKKRYKNIIIFSIKRKCAHQSFWVIFQEIISHISDKTFHSCSDQDLECGIQHLVRKDNSEGFDGVFFFFSMQSTLEFKTGEMTEELLHQYWK